MSLYYETAAILENPDKIGGSFKARIFKKKDLKSKPGQIYALVAEASKWSRVLKDVIEKCAVLKEERKLTPVLALLLTHDLLLSKSGVAAHKDHVLRLAIERHKARLSAAFTKARISYKFPTLEAFREAINAGDLDPDDSEEGEKSRHPRWVRVNTIKSSLQAQMDSTFKGYEKVDTIGEILRARGSKKIYFEDPNIPNLLALPSRINLTKTPGYVKGEIIFQDKASCFPAYLLDLQEGDGDVIDGCAAPGNKTTHAAAIVSSQNAGRERKVIAFERDKGRTEILKKMVKLAGADSIVTVKGSSDFIAAKPNSPDYESVGAILLDPSCSGTGIVGRDDAIKLHLPSPSATLADPPKSSKSKKRKRDTKSAPETPEANPELTLDLDDTAHEEVPLDATDKLAERLAALSSFQLHILTHAMRFRAARKITYSTCSIHFEENEGVVLQALATSVARERGWRILRREEQVSGLRGWERRGEWVDGKVGGGVAEGKEREDVLEGCVRCDKGTGEGTMGFFVAAFVREGEDGEQGEHTAEEVADLRKPAAPTAEQDGDEEEEWDGFSDDEAAADLKAKAEAAVQEQEKKKEVSAPVEKKSKSKKRKTGK
ncbi:S-adenosyl-L-methionine-dependent methyltransferase [Boeremia exigua]|uniref:S-adenosyl-L-methionine-dependent methyltransferase n=1 Tax=Boeremia exigua TaxID=749465 RepID=UPI001E8D2288|nr:S-adenosyl-L-methionine-dependent methyltransferase [Boeremia exigua]KAH6644481.1 S-adenosyl-L-methionine-dependent methyltransferase [Boeremia exigua]